jgi:hypothetical protein
MTDWKLTCMTIANLDAATRAVKLRVCALHERCIDPQTWWMPSCMQHGFILPAPGELISSIQPSIFCDMSMTTTMSYLGRNPSVFFRVEDDCSQAQRFEHAGILSRNQSNASFHTRLSRTRQSIRDHLDWASREPSVFISVYSDWTTALREARRRLADGHENVVIWKIDTQKGYERARYRNIRLLASRCRIRVPRKAWNNSEHEWLFLHRVPDSMIVRYCTAV